jgi:branched-chain amino acid transport system permease protein
MLGATFGCLGGAFFAVKVGSVFPHSFELLVSINALALIILGGMGSIPGVIVGAIVLVGLPELLREFAEYRLLFYGAILIGMMILKPEGLLPNRHVARSSMSARGRGRPVLERRRETDRRTRGDDDMTIEIGQPRGRLPDTDSPNILEARAVTKIFGGLTANKDVDFDIPRRRIVSLIGPNGAGKTTFFNQLTGMFEPSSGRSSSRGSRSSA